jgi:hypothetical protein
MHFYMHSYLHKNFILVKSGCYIVGCAQGRDLASGWAGEEVSAHAQEKIEKGCLFFKSFLNFKQILIQIRFEFRRLLLTQQNIRTHHNTTENMHRHEMQ